MGVLWFSNINWTFDSRKNLLVDSAYTNGQFDGYNSGYDDGYHAGESSDELSGYSDGYSDGYSAGQNNWLLPFLALYWKIKKNTSIPNPDHIK